MLILDECFSLKTSLQTNEGNDLKKMDKIQFPVTLVTTYDIKQKGSRHKIISTFSKMIKEDEL